jgi:2-polyprenyl-6-methoxyphenol hydroxylase-like FAD-dependent oxidoreductase
VRHRNGRILIVGAGIAGPTLAYWLRQYGFTPTLVEHAPKLRTGGYMIDFWGVGYEVADRMGMLPVLAHDGYRIEEVRLVDSGGKRVAGFDAQVMRAATHDRFISLPRSDLSRRLFECIDGTIETIFAETVTSIEEDAAGLTVGFAHAPRRRFDLLVGADGLHSSVRGLVFGASTACEHSLGYYTAAFSASAYPHRDDGAYVCYSIPGGQIARYALRGGRSAFFFIFARSDGEEIPHDDAAIQRRVLRERFGGRGWECDEILRALSCADDLYFDAVSQIRLPQWSRGRVALVGDAAHAPSLLAGQGAALAMAGAYVLANALQRAAGDHDIAYAAYQRRFKPFVDAKQHGAERLGWWFAPRSKTGIRLRNLTTRLLDLPLVATGITARALGDRFELPA